MIRNTKSSQSGFTLIEMLFYVLFIAFIMGSTFGIIHQLLRNSDNLKAGVNIEEEGNFILKKISWVLNDSAVNIPSTGSSPTLYVTRNGAGGNVFMDLNSGIIRINTGSGFKQLSNDRFVIANLTFTRTGALGSELIRASFNIGSSSFEITRMIR